MAERIVSPGVFTRENDLSFLAQGVGEIGAAFIGPFKQGPAFVPTIVRTQSEFEDIFGTPDGTYYTEYAVQNYLREAGQATIVRVAGIGGYTQAKPLGILASGSYGQKIVGVLYSTNFGDEGVGFLPAETNITSSASTSGSFTISGKISSGSGAASIESSILSSATNDLADVFGESPFGAKAAYSYLFFESASLGYKITDGGLQGVKIYEANLPDQVYGDAQEAETPIVQSQLISGERYNLFQFKTIGHGTLYNTKFKVGISNVKAAGEDGATDYSTFTVTIRSYSDTDKRKSVVETFNNVNLDPASPNYIARRIGDRYFTIDSNGKITEYGDYTSKSKYVRVVVQDSNANILGPGSYPISAAPFGHEAYTNPIATTGQDTLVPAVSYQTGSANNTSSSPVYYSGFDFEDAYKSLDNKQYLKPIPTNAVAGANVAFAFDGGQGLSYVMTGSASTDMVKRQFVLGFQFGFDGTNPTVKIAKAGDTGIWGAANTQGFNCATSTANGSIAYTKAINAVSNPDEYDINMVVTPGIVRQLHPAITSKVIDMVEERQDCFYIADFNDYQDTITDATEQANSVDSNYVATYYPWVKTIDSNTNKLTSVPPSVLMPAVFASNDRLAAEWFAPAGLNRGGITGAVSVLNRLTHAERDTLYENKVNPIAAFPGQGIVAFGQKTLQDKASALDRINVRRLLITLKKFIASTSRFLVFEQNTSTTRNRFLNTVNPYLESVQQRQGLYTFKVVMDESNNTPDVIDRNILAGQIFLQPAKTAEFIVIDFNILPTGASFTA
jgi:phage tail sheath protein FI